MPRKTADLEETFTKLDQVIEALEQGDLSLEESFARYKEGMKLLEACSTSIDRIEKQLIVLKPDSGS